MPHDPLVYVGQMLDLARKISSIEAALTRELEVRHKSP
jgi:hypothetical protein